LNDTDLSAFLTLVAGRRGHFELESGHHGGLWLDLDPLFTQPKRIAPFVEKLATMIRPFDVEIICGPLLGGAFLAQLVAQQLDAQLCFTERLIPADATGLYRASYRLPAAMVPRVRDARIAIVDDVMSAGSALRGTHRELLDHGGVTVVAGALLVLGDVGASYFGERDIPVVAVTSDEYQLWTPADCPLCAKGMEIERLAS
jgi:orotate phosphoribosyltransferase